MKDYGTVQGSAEQAKPLIINVDTVYVHTDIKDIGNGLYEYHEIQYGKDEYIEENTAKAIELESEVETLTQQESDLSDKTTQKDEQVKILCQQITALVLKGGETVS